MFVLFFATALVVSSAVLCATFVVADFAAEVPEPLSAGDVARPRLAARLLFVEASGASATVDCAALPDGAPLTLQLRGSDNRFVEEVSFSVLADWAHEDQVVEVELLPRQRASLDDGSTRLYFALEELVH